MLKRDDLLPKPEPGESRLEKRTTSRSLPERGTVLIGRNLRLCFTFVVTSLMKLFSGGSAGNEQLTAIVGTLLLVVLAIEGGTLLNLGSWLTLHAFVGMLLIPIVVLKLASTGWRMLRYYLRADEYVRRGPPHIALRMLVAPVIVVSTVVLLATGVALLALDETDGAIVGLHKASFIVWFGATSLHVLTRVFNLLPSLRRQLPGTGLRLGLVGASLVAGLVLATLTLPAADHLQDSLSGSVGVDAH